MKNLYNENGTLTCEAKFLTGLKPKNLSHREWIETLRNFRSHLSPEEIKEFQKIRKKESYLRCFDKRSETGKKYYHNNKQKVLQQHKKYYLNNKEEQLLRCSSWAKKNKQKINQIATNWRKNNPDKTKKSQNEWYSKNPDKKKAYAKKQRQKPTWKLRMAVSHTFRRISKKKPTKTEKLLGCTCEEAVKYIETLFEEGMSWDNYGEWHIDHIRPVSSFAENELHLMNRIENLQPLWAEANLSKSNSWENKVKQEA